MGDSSTAAETEGLSLVSSSADQTRRIGEAMGAFCREGDLLALIGPLGAGKTCFVRGLAAGLGIDASQVASPTFVLMHEYEPPKPPQPSGPKESPQSPSGGLVLVHVDAYRLSSYDELQSIGWEVDGSELGGSAVTAVEWADRLGENLPADRLDIYFEHDGAGEQMRRVTMCPAGRWKQRIDEVRRRLTPPATK